MRAARRSLLGLAATGAVLALGGCAHTVEVGPHHTLAVALSDYRITPDAIAAPSGVLTLVVRNYGRLSHNLVIAGAGHIAGSTEAIPPGTEATLYVDLTPGTYTMYSSVQNDDALGLHGALTVALR